MTRVQIRLTIVLLLGVLVATLTLANAVNSKPPEKNKLDNVSSSTGPQYDANGDLKRPTDFRTWVFVGSNIGLQYRPDLPDTTQREQDRHKGTNIGDFHNIYIRPESYEAYLKTGKFPEMTMLVMDVYEAKQKDQKGVVATGFFPGDQRGVEVAVKNSNRPDGKKTDWAYYVFDAPSTSTAEVKKDSECYDCHRKHASVDNVWVQFYPILRDLPPNMAP